MTTLPDLAAPAIDAEPDLAATVESRSASRDRAPDGPPAHPGDTRSRPVTR